MNPRGTAQLALALLALTLTAACGPSLTSSGPPRVVQQRPADVPDAGPGAASASADGDYADRIDSPAVWAALASTPTREITAHTETVKVVIDLQDHDRVYFLQTRRWEIHYYFIQRYLARPDSPIPEAQAFWQREYLSQDRRFIEAALVHYRDQNVWALELIAQDVLDLPRTVRAFNLVRERMYNGAELKYHPVPAHHLAALDTLRAQVPVVTNDDIFASTRYQPLNPGEAYGYLRIFDGPVDAARVRPFDIVVLAEAPLDLPVCAGVITAQLQTPLSHIAVLSANRGTPNMALRDAHHDPSLRALEGRLVHLHVTPQDFTLSPATQSEAERAWEATRPHDVLHPPRRDADVGILPLARITRADVSTVGAKAAGLGELAQIRPAIPLPRAFALPFRAYLDHLHRNGLDAELARMLADPTFRVDPSVREHALEAFRNRIVAAPVDPELLRAVRAQIAATFPGTRVRFRSSTNAEDLPGFNGAGLYLSTSTPADPTDAQVADALRRVWASTWNFQGFEERSYYRIVQEEVAMGVLVQGSIDDDQVVGVAVTGNPFDEGRPGFFINAQLSAGSVTGAANGEVPEQLLYYTWPPPGFLERVASSSRTNGAPVLSNDEATQLAGILRQIQDHAYGHHDYQVPTVMDVEFLLAGPDRHVVIVQGRPYTLRWNEGRGWARPPG